MRWLLVTLMGFFLVGCNSKENKKIEQMDKLESDSLSKKENVVEQRYDIEREAEVLRLFLDAKHCLQPKSMDFKNRCMEYYGIDVDSVGDCFMPSEKLEHQIFPKHYMFKSQLETVYYYPEYESHIVGEPKGTVEEALAAMLRQPDDLNANLAYNRILFHDDKSALPFFYENEDELLNLVVIHDYEHDKKLMKRAAALYVLPKIQEMLEVEHLLFYNNQKRGIKKDLIRMVGGIDKFPKSQDEIQVPYLENIATLFIKCYEKIDLPVELKDECCCYLAMLGREYDDNYYKRGGDTYCAEGVIGDMIYTYGFDFIDRVRRNNYFNNEIYRKIVENGVVFNDPLGTPNSRDEVRNGGLTLKARVRDMDGYVNVRETSDVNSKIIGTVLTNCDVIVTEDVDEIYSNKMVKIETDEGLKGYIHGSRLEFFGVEPEHIKALELR